jgi:hypothetical protein
MLILLRTVFSLPKSPFSRTRILPSLLPSSIFSKWLSSKPTSKTIKDEVAYEGFRNIVRRTTKLPNDQIVVYDVLKQTHESVVVFSWDSKTKTTSLVEEYHPGPEVSIYGTVAGMYFKDKDASAFECAQHELEEEAQLQTKKWIPLLANLKTSMPFDKYSNNRFYPYLALDCESVPNPRPGDDDEFITVHKNVTYSQIMKLIADGKMNVVSTYTCLLAFKKLEELGIEYK